MLFFLIILNIYHLYSTIHYLPITGKVRPTIELPVKTEVSWPGHRFSLGNISPNSPGYRVSKLSQLSNRTASLSMVEETRIPRQKSQHKNGISIISSAREFDEGVGGTVADT